MTARPICVRAATHDCAGATADEAAYRALDVAARRRAASTLANTSTNRRTDARTDRDLHQSAELLRACRGQLSLDADKVRVAIAATMQLGAHAVRVVANHYLAEPALLTTSGAHHLRPPHSDPVAESADWLYGFE